MRDHDLATLAAIGEAAALQARYPDWALKAPALGGVSAERRSDNRPHVTGLEPGQRVWLWFTLDPRRLEWIAAVLPGVVIDTAQDELLQ